MLKSRDIIALGLLVILSGLAAMARPLDPGGRVIDYVDKIASAHGEHRLQGDIYSAGTMWLGYDETCVETNARLFFHGAFTIGQPYIAVPFISAIMASYYPLPVYKVVSGWLKTTQFSKAHSLSGAQLIALGTKECR